MKSLRNTATFAALAAFVGLGAVAASTTPASAYIYRTDCIGDTCVRVRCDDDGAFCVRVGYRTYSEFSPEYREVCDAFGSCRYVRTGYYDEFGNWHPSYDF
ncbi:MAG: hypothetical protein ACT4OG_03815 [Alphaproteobacteria bacterium]